MHGVLLDPKTGRPESGGELLTADGLPVTVAKNLEKGWFPAKGIERAPASVLEYLAKSRQEKDLRDEGVLEGFLAPEHRNSMQSWQELIYTIIADGTAVTGVTVATILVPDFTLPANYFIPGRTLRYTLYGRLSTVITTPGTLTMGLRYGGIGGTVLATSGAYAPDPTAASTNLTFWVEYVVVCRSAGAAGTVMCVGRMFLGDWDDASVATQFANVAMEVIPASAPATAAINTTTANALTIYVTPSVTTASIQAHVAILESLS